MLKNVLTFLFLAITTSILYSQEPTQTIRGTIYDKQSQAVLTNVKITLLNVEPIRGTFSDEQGRFELQNVKIGRVSLKLDAAGYESMMISNLILNAGKELVLNLSMEEKVKKLEEVVIKGGGTDKKNPLNETATVSARSFNVDETNRYAGSLGDPSRMATNFAGVAVAGDARNDIVIRGNSPMGVLWRMDGINIPNPNHFGSLGTTGGPVSMLNNNLLDNSDFMTGAFPAEYGNALSGAFDLKMRTGNNQKREFLGQIGFNGFELGTEGPFSKKSGASYLANYRYSTLGLLSKIGIKTGYGSVPQYQDLSFKIDIPGVKYGRFSLFGIGGISYIELLDKNHKEGDFTVSSIAEDTYFGSKMGVMGLSHKIFLNSKTLQTISLAASGTQNSTQVDSLFNNKTEKMQRYGQKSTEMKYSLVYNLNSKINTKNTLNGGVIADVYHFNYGDSVWHGNNYIQLTDFNGSSLLIQPYFKWQHRFSDKLVLNAGLHYQHFMLNNSKSLEPRLGLKWKLTDKQSLSFGTGMHSQLQAMSIYFYKTHLNDGSYEETNKNLGFSKSNHFVVAYDNNFALNWRFKTEAYYQQLYNIPVEMRNSTFSTLNLGATYYFDGVDSLVNNGKGQNYGVEFTLEKFFSKHYYALVTASIYDSKYTGSNGVQHNTAFNGNYTFNALIGGEFNLDKSGKKVLTLNAKANYAGGKRYTEVLLAQSQLEHRAVYDYDHAFEKKYKDYSRIDIKIGFKLNGKKVTQEWALDIQNILNRKNIFQQVYDPYKGELKTEYQLGFFPMVTYRLTL